MTSKPQDPVLMLSPGAALQRALGESPGINHTGSTGTAGHFPKASTKAHTSAEQCDKISEGFKKY